MDNVQMTDERAERFVRYVLGDNPDQQFEMDVPFNEAGRKAVLEAFRRTGVEIELLPNERILVKRAH